MIDLQRTTHELHHEIQITVTTSLTPENNTAWEVRIEGSDFLDGKWYGTIKGITYKKVPWYKRKHSVLEDVDKAIKNHGFDRRYPHRGE